MNSRRSEAALDALVAGSRSPLEVADELGTGIDTLPALAQYLSGDLPIDALERIEALFKCVLRAACEREVSPAEARTVAAFQQRVGFLLKYKPYAIKCANPLGYSLFIQNPGEGFSFQRHIEHKVEVFHIVEAMPGGYAFICDYSDWERDFEPEAFARWLAGAPDPRYDRHRHDVSPGDVFVIDQLNIVHTVVGCVLEEFATVSTDMVDRLFDQNEDKPIPAEFSREFVRARLEGLGLSGREPGRLRKRVRGIAGLSRAGACGFCSTGFVGASVYSVDEGVDRTQAAGPGTRGFRLLQRRFRRVVIGGDRAAPRRQGRSPHDPPRHSLPSDQHRLRAAHLLRAPDRARGGVLPAYLTVSVPFMPPASWPGTWHRNV